MPLVPVTGHFENPDGSPASGSVTFTLEGMIFDAEFSPPRLVAPTPIKVQLDANGRISLALYTTSGIVGDTYSDTYSDTYGGTLSAGVTYAVEEDTTAGQVRYAVTLPYGGLDLASAAR